MNNESIPTDDVPIKIFLQILFVMSMFGTHTKSVDFET
jgi:hypothetical protein